MFGFKLIKSQMNLLLETRMTTKKSKMLKMEMMISLTIPGLSTSGYNLIPRSTGRAMSSPTLIKMMIKKFKTFLMVMMILLMILDS